MRVSLRRCLTYDRGLLEDGISRALEDIGFDPAVFRGARVILKPNLMMPARPEKAVATHPEFFRAAARTVKRWGGTPVLAECPGFLSLERIVNLVGYREVLDEEGIELGEVKTSRDLHYAGARTYRNIAVASAFFEADVIVNLPKLKTHGFTYISGAVKNLFGTMPGLSKSRMHMRAPEIEAFAHWLLDLYTALLHGFEKPKVFLHLMDAIVGQEGEGPGPSGTPRRIGALLASGDAMALDYVATRLLGFDPKKVPTLAAGFERRVSIAAPEEIEVVGDRLEDLAFKDFKPTRSTLGSHVLRGPLISPTAKNLFVERPVPRPDRCTLCYQCRVICPAGAISRADEKGKTPVYDYRKCIRCLCCLEVCPEAAIRLEQGRLQWVLQLNERLLGAR
jgi:uncharacterized protein (DUF362 family)/Pyruvate/2-oxoacid:ferredoxin oxidoreductase delta subunit